MAVKAGMGPIGRSLRETVLHRIAGQLVLMWIAIASGRPIPLPDNPGSGSSGQPIKFSRNPSAVPHFQRVGWTRRVVVSAANPTHARYAKCRRAALAEEVCAVVSERMPL